MACCTQILPNPLPTGTINLPYSVILTAADAFGNPCTGEISVTGGTLPNGIIFTITDEGTQLIGTPTQSGTFILIVQITHKGCPTINDIPLTLIINGPEKPKKKKNRGVVFICPDEIFFKANVQHPQVKYCNQIYNFYSADKNGFLYYIKSNSNISLRGTRNWRVASV